MTYAASELWQYRFEGMRPGSDSRLGATSWHRNVLAVTG